MRRVLCALLICAITLGAGAETRLVTISNIKPRLSKSGEIVNAHDGTIQWLQGKWYYHGAQYREDPDPPQHGGQDTGSPFHNVSIWTSPDLSSGSWEFVGQAVQCHLTPGCDKLYRPHTVYNPTTKLFVQYWNTRSNTNGVATSPSPDGPFTFRGRMNLSYHAPGDFDVFVDRKGDGAAYIIFSAVEDGHYIYIERLTPDFLNGNGEGVLIPGGHRDPVAGNLTAFPIEFNEAPAMFERNGKYYALFGHCCAFCYQGSGAFVFVADHPAGPWQGQPNPTHPGHPMDVGCVDGAKMPTPTEANTLPKTAVPTEGQGCQYNGHWPLVGPPKASASAMRAQQNFVIEVQTPDGPRHIWTGDRWMQAPDGYKSHEPQFWAVLEFTDQGHIKPIKWVNEFSINMTLPQETALPYV